jgi:hypothetical protein
MSILDSLLLIAVVAPQQPTTLPEAPAHRVSEEIRIDGILDEPAWASVPTIGRLLQQEPNPESEPTMETEVRVLFDRDHLYFGILCRDDDPSAIVANQISSAALRASRCRLGRNSVAPSSSLIVGLPALARTRSASSRTSCSGPGRRDRWIEPRKLGCTPDGPIRRDSS